MSTKFHSEKKKAFDIYLIGRNASLINEVSPDSCFSLPCFDYMKHVSKEIVLMTKGLMLDMMSEYLSASLCILHMRGILKWKELDWKRVRGRLAWLSDIMMLCDLRGQIFRPIFSCLWCCPMKTLPGPRAELAGCLLVRGPQMLFLQCYSIFLPSTHVTNHWPPALAGRIDSMKTWVGFMILVKSLYLDVGGVVHFWKQLWLNQRYLHILSWFGKWVVNWSACQ